MTMRIAVDASSLLTRHPRGEGRTLLRLYQEIAQIRPGWRFVFFGTQKSASADELQRSVPGSEIRTFQMPGYHWNLWENLGLPWAAWRSGADLLHCASSGTPRWSPLPVVMTVHDLIPLIMDDGMTETAVQRFRTRLTAGVQRSNSIIAVSHHTKSDLIRVMHADAGKIKVVHWGADAADSAYIARPNSHVVLGFGGGGSVRKNTPALLRMFAPVAAADIDAQLVVVGVTDNRQREQLQSLIDDLSLQGRVQLMGYVDDKELDRLFREAACLVYVSLYEGFGLPPLEVMVHGMPVVASDRSSIPEVIADAGVLVDPENMEEITDAVLGLLRDRKRHRELSEKSWNRARKFNWRTTAEQTIAVFEAAART